MTARSNECRFCLKTLEISENFKTVDEEIKQSFKFVTHIDLKSEHKYSKVVCELCLRSLQLAHAVIIQFTENQRKLESKLNHRESAPSTSSDPLAHSLKTEVELPHDFSIKDEPELSVIRYEPFESQDDNEMDYNDGDYQSANWSSAGSRETKLNKEERAFWHNIAEKTGKINQSVLYILQMNGYNSIFSFQGHFAGGVDNEDLLQSLQQSVRLLDSQSEHVKNINVGRKPLESFEFTLGERCFILGLFEKIKKMIMDGSIERLGARDEKQDSLLISRTKYNLEPEHLQQTIETVLRHRINNFSMDFPIIKSHTGSFPYTIFVKCVKCGRSLRVTVTEDRKANGRKNINIRTHHCIAHIKNCNMIS